MLTEFRIRKLDDLFAVLDADGNGVIDRADFLAHLGRLAADRGWSEDHPAVERIRAAKLAMWEELRAAGGGGDRLGREAWRALFARGLREIEQTGKPPPWVFRVHRAIFASIDADGDGRIRADEYAAYLRSLGSDTDGAEVFRRADLDGDGAIGLDETEDLLMQWLVSDDPDDPGHAFPTGRA